MIIFRQVNGIGIHRPGALLHHLGGGIGDPGALLIHIMDVHAHRLHYGLFITVVEIHIRHICPKLADGDILIIIAVEMIIFRQVNGIGVYRPGAFFHHLGGGIGDPGALLIHIMDVHAHRLHRRRGGFRHHRGQHGRIGHGGNIQINQRAGLAVGCLGHDLHIPVAHINAVPGVGHRGEQRAGSGGKFSILAGKIRNIQLQPVHGGVTAYLHPIAILITGDLHRVGLSGMGNKITIDPGDGNKILHIHVHFPQGAPYAQGQHDHQRQ